MQINTVENNEITKINPYIEVKNTKNTGYNKIQNSLLNIFDNIISKSEKEESVIDFINDKFLDLDFASEYDINTAKIDMIDASFFINLLNENNIINYNVEQNTINSISINDKTINVTSSLLNILQDSYQANKPVRLDFDKDVTVILKMDKDGKVQAHFVPGTAEVESYLKTNLISLKQRFDEGEINYSSISYSKYKDENKNKNNSKKEDK